MMRFLKVTLKCFLCSLKLSAEKSSRIILRATFYEKFPIQFSKLVFRFVKGAFEGYKRVAIKRPEKHWQGILQKNSKGIGKFLSNEAGRK